MPPAVASAASCMAAPRRCTSIKPVLELHHAGKDHGRVFAQAQPGGGLAGEDHVGRFGPQRFQGGQAGDEDRRLAADGRVQTPRPDPRSRAWPDRSRALRRRDRKAGGRRATTRPTAGPFPPSARLVREREMRFCSRLGLDDFSAHVMTTFRADRMRGQCRAALLAIGDLLGFLGIVRTAFAGAGITLPAFRDSHIYIPLGDYLHRKPRILNNFARAVNLGSAYIASIVAGRP